VGFIKNFKEKAKEEFAFYNDMLKNVILNRIDERYLSFNRSLVVYGESKDDSCIYLGVDNTNPVWLLELSKEGTESIIIPEFERVVQNHSFKENSKITIFYSKRPTKKENGEEGFYDKQSTYLFSYSKKLIEDIAFELELELLPPTKIKQALYDIGLINSYHVDSKTMALKSRFHLNTIPTDEVDNLYFKQIFAEGVYGALVKDENPKEKKYHLYQGLNINGDYLSKELNLYALYSEPWYGYIAINMNFTHTEIKDFIVGVNNNVNFAEKNKDIRRIYKYASENSEELASISAVCNVVACIDRIAPIDRLGGILNVQFIPKRIRAKNIIYSTPLLYKDGSYDFVSPTRTLKHWVQVIHKKHNSVSRTQKHLYGRDVSHNFINYSWSETNASLHWAIVAPTRSGKTFAILKTIQSILGAEIANKTEEEKQQNKLLFLSGQEEEGEISIINQKVIKAPKLGINRIVHFDVGQSAYPFVQELKHRYPQKVHISTDNINNMRFGLLNIGFNKANATLNENDLLFSISIINLVLSLNSGGDENAIITGGETAQFAKALIRVFTKRDYEGLSIVQLEELGGYSEVIQRIYQRAKEQGVDMNKYSKTTELGLEGTELDFIQKPTLMVLLKELTRKSKSTLVSEKEIQTVNSLIAKLETIKSMPMFAFYDKQNIDESDYYYLELQQLKELGDKYFLPAYMITLRRLYRRDVNIAMSLKAKGKAVPDTIYIMEEVHNFTKIPLLEDYFEVITREASRYNIYFGFITQSPRDIPMKILNNIGSRMVLSSNRVTKNDLSYYWSNDEEDKEQSKYLSKFYHTRKRKYLIFISSGEGIVTIEQDVSSAEAGLFNSNGKADIAEEIEEEVA